MAATERLNPLPLSRRWPAALLAALAIGCASAAYGAREGADLGAKVYSQAGCVACHGGLGYGGAGPAFRGDRLLSADEYVVGQILIGRGIMPSFADRLSDEEIAAVATYIRESWGNDFGPIHAQQVASIRKSLNTQGSLSPKQPE